MAEGTGRAVPWIRGGVLLVAAVAACVLLYNAIPDRWFEQEYLDAVLRRAGPMAPVAYIAVKALVIIVAIIPSAPLDVAAGALFGPGYGSVYSLAGSQLGAMACFFLARRLGREAVANVIRKDISFCDRCSQKHLALMIFFARLEPIFSFALVSYGAGLTGISSRAFAVSTFLGMTPPVVALSFYGKSFFSGNLLMQIILGVVLVILMFAVPVWIKRSNPWGLYEKMKDEEDGRR